MFQATVKDLMLQHDNFYEQENIEDVLMEFAAEEGLLDDGKLDADDISEMRYYTISEEYREKLGSYFEETQSDINYSKVQQGINEILDTGKISEEQIKNNPDLLAFLEHKLGFNDFKKKVNEPSDHLSGGRQFIEFLKRGNMLEEGEHEEYDGNKEYSIKKSALNDIESNYLNIDASKEMLVRAVNDKGLLPELNTDENTWVTFKLENGKSVDFIGADAVHHAKNFREIYNSSEIFRDSMKELLGHNDETYTVFSAPDGQVPRGYSNLDKNYISVKEGIPKELLIHEIGHNMMHGTNDGGHAGHHDHGRGHVLWNHSVFREAQENGANFGKVDGEDRYFLGKSMVYEYSKDKLKDNFTEKRNSGSTIETDDNFWDGYDAYHEIKDALKDGDTQKALKHFNDIPDDKTLTISGGKYLLKDFIAEEMLIYADREVFLGEAGDMDFNHSLRKAYGEMSNDTKEYFDDAAEQLGTSVDEILPKPTLYDQGGISNQDLKDNMKHIQTIAANWDKWNGKDSIVSVKDLRKIASNDNGKGGYSQAEQDAAQFILDNDDMRHVMDTAKHGDSMSDGDTKISTRDMAKWLEKTNLFGKDFIEEHKKHIQVMGDRWDVWNGNDTIVSKADLEKIAKNEGTNSFGEKWSKDEQEAAQFMLDNPEFRFFLDIEGGSQSTADEKIGSNFPKWFESAMRA